MTFRCTATLGLVALLAASPAMAHVTADRAEMPANSYVRIAFRVGHGCDGAATTGIRLTIPPELRGASPMPHPGWTLSLGGGEASGHAGHAGHHGSPMPQEIAWTGGRLDSAYFDEFVLLVRSPAEAGATLAFPVVQECEGGAVARWVERAPPGGGRVSFPAPVVRVVAGR